MMCFLIDDAQSMQNELSMGTVTHVANLWKQLCQPGAKTGLTFKILMSSFCSYLELRCVPLIDDTQNMQYELIYHFLQLIKIKKINFILLKYLPATFISLPLFSICTCFLYHPLLVAVADRWHVQLCDIFHQLPLLCLKIILHHFIYRSALVAVGDRWHVQLRDILHQLLATVPPVHIGLHQGLPGRRLGPGWRGRRDTTIGRQDRHEGKAWEPGGRWAGGPQGDTLWSLLSKY